MASNVAPFEFLWIVKESAYGTQKSVPVAGTDSIYVRLSGANRFTPRPVPNYVVIPFGGGFAIEAYRVTDKTVVSGNLQLELCYAQAQLLLDWCVTRINAGQTVPWTTTEPPGDLASCTVYHGIMRDDGTIKRRRYKGVKVHDWKVSASSESSACMLALGLQAQKPDGNTVDATADPDATAFPAPADTAFPTDLVLFQHCDSNVSVGATMTYVAALDLSAKNDMDAPFFSSHFTKFDRLRGRHTQAEVKTLYTASPNWRTAMEAITPEATSVTFTNTTHTILFTLNAQNVVTAVQDDLTPGQVYMQSFTLLNQYDTAASSDVTFTYT